MDAKEEIRKNRSYNGIDVIKFLMCSLVVMSHTSAFSSFGSDWNFAISHIIAHLAIPVYFMASGFFLFKKIKGKEWSETRKVLKTYILRIFRMYTLWSIVYFPLYISLQKSKGMSLSNISCQYLYDFIFCGTYIHLWYLLALIVATAILSLAVKSNLNLKWLLVAGFVLYLIGALGDSYYGIGEKIPVINVLLKNILIVFKSTRNGIFVGLFFVVLGAYFSDNMKNENVLKCKILSFAFMLCLLVEGFVLRKYNIPKGFNTFLFLIPTAYYMFQWALQANLENRKVYKEIRSLSIVIYCIHLWVAEVVRVAQKMIGFSISNSLVYFLIVFCISLVAAIILRKMEQYRYFKWLKIFY